MGNSPELHQPPALPYQAFLPSQALLFSLNPLIVRARMGVYSFWKEAREQCVTVPSALLYLVPAPVASGQELGPEQSSSQAPDHLAIGIQVKGLNLVFGSQGIA